jgi:hypothetical protein
MSKETLQALEADLAELKKKLELGKNERNIAKSLLKTGTKEIESYGQSAIHHRNNLVHMKREADVVDMDEYFKVKMLYLEAKDCLTIAKQQVSQANKAIKKLDLAISTLETEYKAVLKALDTYGELVPFPNKMAQ